MAKFAALLEFGDGERVNEVRPRHRAYLEKLLADGKVYASGPWVDNTGALLIYDAADEAEARAMLDADPYIREGVLTNVRLKEWKLVFAAGT